MTALNWPLISRALSNHDPCTLYTLLSEGLPKGIIGNTFLALIRTEPGWPVPSPASEFSKSRLSSRELESLHAANDGLSIIDTAKKMFVSVSTVKSQRARIFEKLDVRTIADATRRGRELGLIE